MCRIHRRRGRFGEIMKGSTHNVIPLRKLFFSEVSIWIAIFYVSNSPIPLFQDMPTYLSFSLSTKPGGLAVRLLLLVALGAESLLMNTSNLSASSSTTWMDARANILMLLHKHAHKPVCANGFPTWMFTWWERKIFNLLARREREGFPYKLHSVCL